MQHSQDVRIDDYRFATPEDAMEMSTRYRVVENFRMLAILRTPLLSGAASRALVVAAVLGCAVASIMPGASMASTGALATHNGREPRSCSRRCFGLRRGFDNARGLNGQYGGPRYP